MSRKASLAFVAGALICLGAPGSAWAGDNDKAIAAIAAAEAKIEAASKGGTSPEGADLTTQATTRLAEAQHQHRKGEDRKAIALAREADALAGQAMASAELGRVETERDQVAAQ